MRPAREVGADGRRRAVVAREAVDDVAELAPGREAADRSDARQVDRPHRAPAEGVERQAALDVVERADGVVVARAAHVLQHGAARGDQVAPLRGVRDRHGDEPVRRRAVVGEHDERVAARVDDAVGGVAGEDGLPRAAADVEAPRDEVRVRRGALARRDHHPAPIVRHVGAELPRRAVGAFVDEHVGGLRRAQPVEVDLGVGVGRLEGIGAGRGVVAVVVEAAAVGLPRGAGELDARERLGQVAPARHVADADGPPVRSAVREQHRHVIAALRRREARERDGAVGGERVRVDEHALGAAGRRADVGDALVLQAAVARDEREGRAPRRDAHARIGEDLVEARADGGARRKRVERRPRVRRLRGHERLRLRRLRVFEPPVRIGDGDAVERIDDRPARRGGVGRARLRKGRRGGEDRKRGRHEQTTHRIGRVETRRR